MTETAKLKVEPARRLLVGEYCSLRLDRPVLAGEVVADLLVLQSSKVAGAWVQCQVISVQEAL